MKKIRFIIFLLSVTIVSKAQIYVKNPVLATTISPTPIGYVGIGINKPLHKLHVHNGIIMISGSNTQGGPMIAFSDNTAANQYPNGRWGIEYEPTAKGLNFWKPWNTNTGGGGNYYMLLKDDGKIGMGLDPTVTPNLFPAGYRLYVKDGILTEKVKIALTNTANWADYVFAPNYKLKPLNEVEAFVKENKHLPNVPSAEQIIKDGGIDVNQMFAKQMEKIEELTLYMIELKKENVQLKIDIEKLRVKFYQAP